MRKIKLLICATAGVALFSFGFTIAAFWYEPAIDVLGVVVQFLLVFVGLLGIDEWHRQFKFHRKWEKHQMKLKEFENVKTTAEKCQKAIFYLYGYIDSGYIRASHKDPKYNPSRKEIRETLLNAVNYSQTLKNLLASLENSCEQHPSCKEIKQFWFNLSQELKHFDKNELADTIFVRLTHDDENMLTPQSQASQPQTQIGDFLNKYGPRAKEWSLIDAVNTSIRQENSELNSLGN